MVFGLTRPGLEPTIYRTRSEYANSTNLQTHELVIFNQTMKIDTHEEKYFHSMMFTIHILYIYGSAK
jgi:hypothetical protein